MTRTARLRLAVLLAAVVALAALAATCAHEHDVSAPSPRDHDAAPAVAKTPLTKAPRRRTTSATDASAAVDETPRGASGEVRATPPAPTTGIRVVVTMDGRPAADVDVWLRGASDGPPIAPLWSDGAYFGVPMYLGLSTDQEAGATSRAGRRAKFLGAPAGRTGADGTTTIAAAGGCTFEIFAASESPPRVARRRTRVTTVEGTIIDAAVALRAESEIRGRCIDADDKPVALAWVQAFSDDGARAASALVQTDAQGAFVLDVDASSHAYRVRAVASRKLTMSADEAALPRIPSDVMVVDVAPDGDPIELRMRDSATVMLDVTADVPFNHLQLEGLVYDSTAAAWGRLGGPAYQRTGGGDRKRAFAAVPRADADRPFCIWSWGNPPMLTAFDPRGRDRVDVALHVGRRATVEGRGWKPDDRVRVVCRAGRPGEEIPVIWVEESVSGDEDAAGRRRWRRDDTPPSVVEFRLVRAGREIGARPSVPAGADEAPVVRIDL